jgi:uncharacterized membrane protein YoaK (UPF0700 family)
MRRPSYLSGLLLIAAVCGLIDAACFLALGGVFAEIMTGNILLLAFRNNTKQYSNANANTCPLSMLKA